MYWTCDFCEFEENDINSKICEICANTCNTISDKDNEIDKTETNNTNNYQYLNDIDQLISSPPSSNTTNKHLSFSQLSQSSSIKKVLLIQHIDLLL